MSSLVGKVKDLVHSRSRESDGTGDDTNGPSSEATGAISSSERGYRQAEPLATRSRTNEAGGVNSISRGLDDLSLRNDQTGDTSKPLPQVPEAGSQQNRQIQPGNISPTDSSARKPLPPGSREDTTLLTDSAQRSENLGTASSGPGTSRSAPRLPKDFDLKDSVNTDVSTEIKPAITQERVLHDVKHVEHKAITRDYHIDHHHKIIQPVKVVEILPATHYTLDPATGQKVEIPAPEGWKIPSNMEPNSQSVSSHISSLRQITRDYVVDEENPDGKFDPPPAAGYADSSRTDTLARDERELPSYDTVTTVSPPAVPPHDPSTILQATENTGRAVKLDADQPPVLPATATGVSSFGSSTFGSSSAGSSGVGGLAFTPSRGQ